MMRKWREVAKETPMWTIKHFESREKMQDWIERSGPKNVWNEIFVNNGYAVEYKPLVKVRMPR